MMPETWEEQTPFISLLQDKMILKCGHNIKFEQAWSEVILGTNVEGWHWDSMLAAHILDNRPNITGLKFQTYVNFGVADYASEVSPWLKSGDKDGNGKNTVEELVSTESGRDKLLRYCAYDSIYEYRLQAMQRQIICNSLPF
jgi:hypothetical protein